MTTEGILWLICALFVIISVALAVENAALRRHLDDLATRLEYSRRVIRETSRAQEGDE